MMAESAETGLLHQADTYEEVYGSLEWQVPERYNMGVDVCDKHAAATPDKKALIVAELDGDAIEYSFAALRGLSNQLANLFIAKGLQRNDRIGILLSQSVEAAISHIAAWKMAAISIPLFTLFGEEALEFRLRDSGAKMLVTDVDHLHKIESIRERLPDLETVLVVDAGRDGTGMVNFWSAMEKASADFEPIGTLSDDPAFICYTSGTTGNPKGALHAHRTMFGHLPGIEFFHDFLPQPGDLMWTPADWAWIAGLMNTLMGSWHHGITNLAYRARKYDPEEALRLMAKYGVRNTFMPPTALKMMRTVPGIGDFGTNLRTITCAGEPMGAELLEWGRESFGLTFNEYYGQTECNLVVANCQAIMEVKPGSMGLPVPGHRVEVIDGDGNPQPAGEVGEIAVRRPDPVMLLEYWNNPEASRDKYRGDWLLMGDQATKDEDGYLWFVGRADDVITSAGYRIGPGEIEDCLTKHPAVSLAAAIGVPDPIRTEQVKAFIVLRPGFDGGKELDGEIREFVATRLSPHESPRQIEFVDSLPLTATGKIKRKDLRDAEIAKLQTAGE